MALQQVVWQQPETHSNMNLGMCVQLSYPGKGGARPREAGGRHHEVRGVK